MEEGIPDIAAGMVGSVFSYLFSTSIWARFAVESRIPGVPARSLWVAIFLMVSDHPFLCASVAGVLILSWIDGGERRFPQAHASSDGR